MAMSKEGMAARLAVDDGPLLVSAKDAAALAGVGLRTWHRLWRSGLAPGPRRIGMGLRPMTRWAVNDLRDWVNGNCEPVGKDGGR